MSEQMTVKPDAIVKHTRGWQAIELEYVQGDDDVTLAALATRHAVHPKTVRRHAADSGWVLKRGQYRGNVAALAQQKSLEADAELLAAQAAGRRESLNEAFGICMEHVCPQILTRSYRRR